VVSSILELSFRDLDTAPQSALRSILDDSLAPFVILLSLSRDKKVAKSVVCHQSFLVDQKFLHAPANIRNVPPMLLHNPLYVETNGLKGAAVENRTMLGKLLRVSPDVRDSRLREMFKDITRTPRNVFEGKVSDLKKRLEKVRSLCSEIMLNLLKCGGPSKDQVLSWLVTAVTQNSEAEKDRPSPLVGSSVGFLINLSAVTLKLCLPILEDVEKLKKVDFQYVFSTQGFDIFYKDGCTPLASADTLSVPPNVLNSVVLPEAAKEYNFMTQSFFLCWRAVHLGIVPQFNKYVNTLRALNHYSEGLAEGEANAIHFFLTKVVSDVQLLHVELLHQLVLFSACCASKLLSVVGSASSDSSIWLVSPQDLLEQQKIALTRVPEHFVDDIVSILLFVSKTFPQTLRDTSLESVLSLVVFFLRRPWSVQSPHLRAKFGQLLYHVFLPALDRSREMWTSEKLSSEGPETTLLSVHADAQKYLAPALLLLYGDVERTGFYEKLSNRRSIMIVLKHLWTLPTHRAAFQGIATTNIDTRHFEQRDDQMEEEVISHSDNSFVRFANGLLNETNALVATTLDKLSEIRKTQLLMQNTEEWSKLPEEERKQMSERHESNEQECKGAAGSSFPYVFVPGLLRFSV
jgi:ubiquitin conjugation factor E4 B